MKERQPEQARCRAGSIPGVLLVVCKWSGGPDLARKPPEQPNNISVPKIQILSPPFFALFRFRVFFFPCNLGVAGSGNQGSGFNSRQLFPFSGPTVSWLFFNSRNLP